MYNGIGLQTPRGSGTSGYIQKNLSSNYKPKQSRDDFLKTLQRLREQTKPQVKKANPDIIKHQQNRQILIQMMKLRKHLEGLGYTHHQFSKDKEHIDKEVAKMQKVLREKMEKGELDESAKDSHLIAQAKEREYSKLREAFKIGKDHKTGSAFDFEGQQAKRMERLAKHSDKPKFPCPFESCHKIYDYEDELQRHLKYKHPKPQIQAEPQVKQKPKIEPTPTPKKQPNQQQALKKQKSREREKSESRSKSREVVRQKPATRQRSRQRSRQRRRQKSRDRSGQRRSNPRHRSRRSRSDHSRSSTPKRRKASPKPRRDHSGSSDRSRSRQRRRTNQRR